MKLVCGYEALKQRLSHLGVDTSDKDFLLKVLNCTPLVFSVVAFKNGDYIFLFEEEVWKGKKLTLDKNGLRYVEYKDPTTKEPTTKKHTPPFWANNYRNKG